MGSALKIKLDEPKSLKVLFRGAQTQRRMVVFQDTFMIGRTKCSGGRPNRGDCMRELGDNVCPKGYFKATFPPTRALVEYSTCEREKTARGLAWVEPDARRR